MWCFGVFLEVFWVWFRCVLAGFRGGGVSFGLLWSALGRFGGRFWAVFGVFLGCVWGVFGVIWGCFAGVLGVCLGFWGSGAWLLQTCFFWPGCVCGGGGVTT